MNTNTSYFDSLESKIYFLRGRRVMLDSDLAFLYGVPTKRLNEQVRRNTQRFPEDFMFQLTQEEFDHIRSQFVSAYVDNNSLRSQIVTLNSGQLSSRSQIATLNDQDGLNEPNLKSQSVTSSGDNLPSRSQIVTLNKSMRSQIETTSKRGQNIKYLPFAFTEQGVAMLSSVLKSEQAILVNIHIMRTFTKTRGMLAQNQQLRELIENLEIKYDANFKTLLDVIELILTPQDIVEKGKNERI